MGVAGERKRHPVGDAGENVRFVHHQNHRMAGIDLRERVRQVILAFELMVAQRMGQLIAHAGEPEAPLRLAEQKRLVFQNRDTDPRERRPDAGDVVPPVVIAEDRPDPEPRPQARQLGRPHRMWNPLGDETMRGEIISHQEDNV